GEGARPPILRRPRPPPVQFIFWHRYLARWGVGYDLAHGHYASARPADAATALDRRGRPPAAHQRDDLPTLGCGGEARRAPARERRPPLRPGAMRTPRRRARGPTPTQ